MDYKTITDEQRAIFERDGFFIVRNVLSQAEVEEVLLSVDKIWNKHHAETGSDYLHIFDFLSKDKAFLSLLDNNKKVLPLILGLMGWNIYLYHSHLDINLPISRENAPDMSWHRDNSRMNEDLRNDILPRVDIKTAYWLSDVSTDDRGNIFVIPGSHRWGYESKSKIGNKIIPEGAVPVLVNQGDVLFFDTRLWHSRSNNFSEITRKVVFLGYGFRWLRARDDVKFSEDIIASGNKYQRQLLVREIAESGYVPKDGETPLKEIFDSIYSKKHNEGK